ncbi:hypothetical protein Ahia01_000004400 [Argonauta hians]
MLQNERRLSKHESRFKPENVSFSVKFNRFLHNPAKGTYFTRTPKNWGQIFLFFLCFYTLLFGASAGMFTVFVVTLPKTEPRLQGDDSLLKGVPGLSVDPSSTGNFIYFNKKSKKSSKHYIDTLTEKIYELRLASAGNPVVCKANKKRKPKQVCKLEESVLVPKNSLCNWKNNFGYHEGHPCFIIQLNKIYGWTPEAYNSVKDVPRDYPKDRYDNNSIGIRCFGRDASDIDNIGDVHYFPAHGLPFGFYPFTNQEEYIKPIVWIHFSSIQQNMVVNIRCKAYAKNFQIYSRKEIHVVDFSVLID